MSTDNVSDPVVDVPVVSDPVVDVHVVSDPVVDVPVVDVPVVTVPVVEVPVVTTPVVTAPVVSRPVVALSPIANIDTLIATVRNARIAVENADRLKLREIASPNRSSVQTKLNTWATRGFPANFVIFSVSVAPPALCSDGVKRALGQYIPYLLGTSIADQLVLLQPLLVGIALSYSISGNTISIQVTKP